MIDSTGQAGLDSTVDIVKNPRFYIPMTEIVPPDSDTMLYSTTIPDMNPELETFYISNIKILRMKTHLRELEEEKLIVPAHNVITYVDKPRAIEAQRDLKNKENELPQRPPVQDPEMNLNDPPRINLYADHPKHEKTEEVKMEDQWSSRTLKLLKLLQLKFANSDHLNFDDLSKKKRKKSHVMRFLWAVTASFKRLHLYD